MYRMSLQTEHEIYQHVKVFPEVLCHESEESQESPAEAVKAGVTVVWIPPSFHACVALWAAAEEWRETDKHTQTESTGRPAQKMTQHYLHIM